MNSIRSCNNYVQNYQRLTLKMMLSAFYYTTLMEFVIG